MDIIRFYNDHRIPWLTEGNKHCTKGWVNTHCPWCTGSKSYHLGTPLEGGPFKCWRCGVHPFIPTLARLTGLTEQDIKGKLRSYGRAPGKPVKREVKRRIRTKSQKYPTGVTAMTSRHHAYLRGRGFDPKEIEQVWKVEGTGPVSNLDNISFNHRLIYPIIWEGEQVSFQTRDITGRAQLKYITCPQERELIAHKDIVYGLQDYWLDTGICVEGVMDVWKLGPQAFATMGTEWTKKQGRIMADSFKRVVVVYDNEPDAQKNATSLVAYLRFRGIQAQSFTVKTDPGDLPLKQARQLCKELLHEIW